MRHGHEAAFPPAKRPVTDPVRVMLIDPDGAGAVTLARAIDLDRAMAVVSLCRDLRRATVEAERCAPDVVAVRLEMDDPRCASLLAALAGVRGRPGIAVLAATPSAPLSLTAAARLAVRIRAVAESTRSRGEPVVALLAPEPPVRRLH